MSRFYIWTGRAPVIEVDDFYLDSYRHAFIFDSHVAGVIGDQVRWRVLFKGKLSRRTKGHMPREFLMHLLLLGVPT
jgi:hypothetical protein